MRGNKRTDNRMFISAFDCGLDIPQEIREWAYNMIKAASGALYLLTSGNNGTPISTPARLDEQGHADVITALRDALRQTGLGDGRS